MTVEDNKWVDMILDIKSARIDPVAIHSAVTIALKTCTKNADILLQFLTMAMHRTHGTILALKQVFLQ